MISSVASVPTLTTAQMREVDRVMIEDLGIDLLRMMENAGRNLAWLARQRFEPAHVVILAGKGGNGGGGLVAARHLANRGINVTVTLTGSELDGVPETQAEILRALDVSFAEEPPEADLVIDAMIGYSLSGDPRDRTAELIEWANHQPAPVLSLDVPSGLDTTTGMIGDPCIRATATMTLALPKTGLELAPTVVGELYLADISVPASVYGSFEIELDDPFADGSVVAISS